MRTSQRLQARRIRVTSSIIPHFREQTWRKAFARSGQTLEDLMIRMGQKKGVDLLVIGGNLLNQRQQLADQSQHQAQFRAGRDGISCQMGLMQGLHDLGRHFLRTRMSSVFEHRSDLFARGTSRCLGRWVGLQKDERGSLLQLAQQAQCHGIVVFETGCELIDQARLHLNQRILVAGERFQFLHRFAVRSQSAQIGKVRSPRFGQQIGINGVRFGSRCTPPAINGLGLTG